MPCRDYEYEEQCELERHKKADKLTRMLCEAMRLLKNSRIAIPNELSDWWDDHQEADLKARRAEEAKALRAKAKQNALRKLSPAERKLLGL